MPASLLDSFDTAKLNRIRRTLTQWFLQHGRPLPWRETSDPYRIWVSEIMLQQTTVKAVIPYFERFLERFPTVSALAEASEEEVLKYWEGLGYYSRGRNLRKAARQIVDEHGGDFPRDLTQLHRLPGVGRYTAGAIASFAFDLPGPIVEANTLRLYCRLLGYRQDPTKAEGQRLLWQFAELLQPRKGSGVVNQSLMELGSQVCTPIAPACPTCPLQFCCRAFQEGTQGDIPQPRVRPVVTPVVEGTVAILKQGDVLLRLRSESERWAGLWDFPRLELANLPQQGKLKPADLNSARRQLGQRLAQQWSLQVRVGDLISEIRHSVTRYRIRLLCFQGETAPEVQLPAGDWKWVSLKNLASHPLSTTGRQLADRLTGLDREKLLF